MSSSSALGPTRGASKACKAYIFPMQTIDRSKAYIDAGADMIFPEGLATLAEFQTVADALKKYYRVRQDLVHTYR